MEAAPDIWQMIFEESLAVSFALVVGDRGVGLPLVLVDHVLQLDYGFLR